MRKILICLLSVCMLLSVLSACKSKEDNTDLGDPNENQNQTETWNALDMTFYPQVIGDFVDMFSGDEYSIHSDETYTFSTANSNIIYSGTVLMFENSGRIKIVFQIKIDGIENTDEYLLDLNEENPILSDMDTEETQIMLVPKEDDLEGVIQDNIELDSAEISPEEAVDLLYSAYGKDDGYTDEYIYDYIGLAKIDHRYYYIFEWSVKIGEEPQFIAYAGVDCMRSGCVILKYNDIFFSIAKD